MEKDAENALLWKFSHRRLEAEEIRDSMLAVSGRLNAKAGRPERHGPDRSGSGEDAEASAVLGADARQAEYDRRTIYMIYKRNLRLPFMEVFDAPDTLLSCAAARAIDARPAGAGAAERADLERAGGSLRGPSAEGAQDDRRARSIYAWRLAAGRAPTPKEKALALEVSCGKPDDPARLKEFALAVFNLNAFLYVN